MPPMFSWLAFCPRWLHATCHEHHKMGSRAILTTQQHGLAWSGLWRLQWGYMSHMLLQSFVLLLGSSS